MIRRLTPDDADSYSRLRLAGLEAHPEAFGTGADAWRSADPEQVRASLEPGADPTQGFLLGAFAAEELIGLIGFRRERRMSMRHKGSIWGLFVRADHRRRGVGGSLITSALEEARVGDGLRYVRSVVTRGDGAALRLFEAHDFTRYGLEVGGLRAGGVAYDQVFLRCEFTAPDESSG